MPNIALHHRSLCSAWLGASLLLGGAPCAYAQSDSEPAEDAAEPPAEVLDVEVLDAEAPPSGESIDVVVSGTRTPERQQRSTVRVDVVTREEAERRGATNVGEALQGQLGVQVNPSAYGSVGNPAAIQIQGLDADRVLVLEDGERVIGGVGGVVDLSQMPLTDLKRIEVVTGPTSALYGTRALGGVVNVLTGPPLALGASGRARVEGRYPWGMLTQLTGFNRHDSGVWAGIEASAQLNQGLRLREDVVDLAVPSRRQYLAGARFGGTALEGMDFQLRVRWIRDEQLGLTEEQVPGLGRYLIELPEVVDRLVLQSRQTFAFEGGSSLRLSLNRQQVMGQTEKDRVDSPVDELRRREGALQSIEAVGTIADGDRTWVTGLRGEVETFEQRLFRTTASGSGLSIAELSEVAPTMLGSGAAYAQLKWDLHKRFTLLAGARGELHLRYGGVVAPRVAMQVRPLDWLSFRASAGRGFRAPAAREFGFFFDHSALGYRVIGNPDLLPEASWGVNGEVRIAPDQRGMVRAGVYANWIDNLIAIELLQTNAGGVDDYTYRNVAKARTFGGQIDAQYRPAPWLRAEAGYAYTWTRNDTEQQPLPSRPPHTAYAALIAQIDQLVEIMTRYRVVTDAFINEDLRSPGFSTLDARVSVRPLDTLSVYAGGLNLLGARKDPTRLGDQRPLAGTTAYLGLIASFPSPDRN